MGKFNETHNRLGEKFIDRQRNDREQRQVRVPSSLVHVVFLLSFALTGQAGAEPAKPEVPLWTASPLALPAIDIDPARPGIELISPVTDCTASPADSNGLLTVTRSLKIKVHSADGTQVVFAPTTIHTVTSGKFPDPRQSQFQCFGDHTTNYRSQFPGMDGDSAVQGHGVPVGPGAYPGTFPWPCPMHTFQANNAVCDELPETTFGVVVAKVGGERFVLVSQAINLSYYNNIMSEDLSASAYSITAYSLATGAKLWTKSFNAADSDGYYYLGNLARLGDFLGQDGNDEIRLVLVKDSSLLGEGAIRYRYISPKTGKYTKVVTPL